MASEQLKAFLEARDFLVKHRTDYATAYRDFTLAQTDPLQLGAGLVRRHGAGNERPALWVVDEDGSETKLSFAEMSERSNRVANFLRAIGVKRGDRILLMLGNEVPLWEMMLAAIKLGAVVIPATTLLTPDDLLDRFERGQRPARHRRRRPTPAKFADSGRRLHPHRRRRQPLPGWTAFEEAYRQRPTSRPTAPTRADDPLLLYFTSGTTSKPKLVQHTHQSYPVGPSVDDVLARPAARRRASEHQLAGLGQARLELLLRAVERRRLRLRLQLRALRRQGRARRPGHATA